MHCRLHFNENCTNLPSFTAMTCHCYMTIKTQKVYSFACVVLTNVLNLYFFPLTRFPLKTCQSSKKTKVIAR